MREFNTSGPNIPSEHYTLMREELVKQGMDYVNKSRYFTIWAPRQTGKSTYFSLLGVELERVGYKVAQINVEHYQKAHIDTILRKLKEILNESWDVSFTSNTIPALFDDISRIKDRKCVLIIDEIENFNPEYFNELLHAIRNLYHSRYSHCLKSVILVGVSNILGIIQDNASPFNITDNLEVDYFTHEEVLHLFQQHETETGQLFGLEVKEKIYQITAGQPGLVNGFGYKLVKDNPGKSTIDYEDYLKVEDWFLTESVDKNIVNVINKASQYRSFVENLLYSDNIVPFRMNREAIKALSANGLIKKDENGNVRFRVPLYKKCLHDAFYPYMNGESERIVQNLNVYKMFDAQNHVRFDLLIDYYKNYVKRRGFNYFREKDEDGNYLNIKESALIYSFETFIQSFIQMAEGKSYLEPHTGLGRSDLVVNISGREYVFETKIFRDIVRFNKGKKQLAYYCKSIDVKEGIYLVFIPNTIDRKELEIEESKEEIDDIKILTYLVEYDEEKDF